LVQVLSWELRASHLLTHKRIFIDIERWAPRRWATFRTSLNKRLMNSGADFSSHRLPHANLL
jgi:hypothetical protein